MCWVLGAVVAVLSPNREAEDDMQAGPAARRLSLPHSNGDLRFGRVTEGMRRGLGPTVVANCACGRHGLNFAMFGDSSVDSAAALSGLGVSRVDKTRRTQDRKSRRPRRAPAECAKQPGRQPCDRADFSDFTETFIIVGFPDMCWRTCNGGFIQRFTRARKRCPDHLQRLTLSGPGQPRHSFH